MRLPRADPRIMKANANVYSFLKVKPSLAGYVCSDDTSILDNTVKSLIQNEEAVVANFGKPAKWPKDGPNGKLIARNMVQFMRTWDKERTYSLFWIVKAVPSGTILVSQDEEGELGDVYLAKGLGSQIVELIPPARLPMLVYITLVPIYDFLVYDGLVTSTHVTADANKREEINSKMNSAVKSDTLIYQGKSAALGLWDADPPMLPAMTEDGSGDLGWSEDAEEAAQELQLTDHQKKIALKIAKLAKKWGFVAKSKAEILAPKIKTSILIVRRMGYTKSENSNQNVCMMFKEQPVHFFQFEEWPTYNLDEVMSEIWAALVKMRIMPDLLWIDELSVVESVSSLLNEAFEEIGTNGKIGVTWFPPPSEEETVQNAIYGPDGP